MSLRVLAVCAGNICRSPAAEAAIRAEALDRNLDIVVDSAGTGSWNIGDPPSPQMVAAGMRIGLFIDGRARKMITADFDRFDVIVVMDRANLRDVLSMSPTLEARAKVRLFRTYDLGSEDDEIPDPYGHPDQVFDATLQQITKAAAGLVDSLASVGVEDPIPLE